MKYRVFHTMRFFTSIEADNAEHAMEKAEDKDYPVCWDDYFDLLNIEVKDENDENLSK